MKRVLQTLTSQSAVVFSTEFGSQPVEDHGGFGPIRAAGTPMIDPSVQTGERLDQQRLISECVDTISLASHLRMEIGDPTRNDFLVKSIVDCDDDAVFQDLLVPFIAHIDQRRLRLTFGNLDSLLDRLEQPLMSYDHGTSDAFHALATRLLHATMHVWLEESLPEEVHEKVVLVYEWLAEHFINGRLCWWETRDVFRRLCSSYLVADPYERFMTGVKSECLPQKVLILFIEDDDTRVRFGGSEAMGHLFESEYVQTRDPMEIYSDVRDRLCTVLSK